MPLTVERVELDPEFVSRHDERLGARCRCERCILGPGGQGPVEHVRFLVHLVTTSPATGAGHRTTMAVSGAVLWRWAQRHAVFGFVFLPPRPDGDQPVVDLVRHWRRVRVILVSTAPFHWRCCLLAAS
jgi:hypothetical protein